MADLEPASVDSAPMAAADVAAAPTEIMMQFISLGQNCEFGFAQRAYGAEPLDLLRWASTPLPVLVDLLRNRFAGIGDPERIRVYHPPNREYMIEHTGYRFIWHAFAKEGETTPEELKRRECRRLPRLAEILMDHLTEGRRICVIKRDNDLTPEHLAPLMEAIRGYGASPVLLVHCTDDPEKISTVRFLGGGLFLGHLERFSDPAEVPSTTDAKGWLALCRNTLAELRKPGPQRMFSGRYACAAEAEGQARPADGTDVDAMMHAWVTQEIAFWQSRDPRREIVMDELRSRHGTREMEFLFEIRNGDIVPAPKAPATPDRVPIWRPPMYERFLREVVRQHCPELETALLINVADGGPARESVPIFAFQKPRGGSALLLPDVDFLQFDFYRANANFVDDTPYDVKSCSAVFVGSTTGGFVTRQVVVDRSLPRLRSAMFFRDKPEVDFRLPEITNATDEARELLLEMGFGRRDRLSYKQQFEHKFIISMDGFGATCSRVAIALRSNCVLLKYKSNHELYYFDGLKPWVHYLPVSKDEDVIDFISAERRTPGVFADVARNGREFAERYLTRQQAAKYAADLLRTYVSLFRDSDDKADGAPGAPEVRILAHFANVGDVWLAPGADDMKSATKIEGFALRTIGSTRPSDIEYQGLQADGCMTGLFRGGEFCGSRGKAMPLLGFAARLSGQAGGDWCCEYVGHFADGSRVGPLRQGEICRAESGAALRYMEMQIAPRAHMTEKDEHQAVETCVQEMTIDFSRKGNGEAFVGEGWSAQEAGHIWSVGPRSTLAMPRLDPRCSHQLIFDMAPYVAPGGAPTARVGIFAGDRRLGEFELAGVRQKVEVIFPVGSIPSSGPLLLLLEHPDFSRPAEHGHRDDRPLGICMFKLVIRQSGGNAELAATRDVDLPATAVREISAQRPAPAIAVGAPRVAALVLAHAAPAVLATAMPVLRSAAIDVVVHLDAKDDLPSYRAAMGEAAGAAAFIEERTRIFWGGYSMMRAEFALMRRALAAGYDRLLLISDDAFPVVPPAELRAMMTAPTERISYHPIAEGHDFWSRYNHYWYYDHLAGNPRSTLAQRMIDDEYLLAMEDLAALRKRGKFPLRVFYGSQFWCLSTEVARRLLALCDNEHLCESFRFAALPDELMFPSLMANYLSELPLTNGPVFADFTRPPGPLFYRSYVDLPTILPAHIAFIRKVAPDAVSLARDISARLLDGERIVVQEGVLEETSAA